MISVVYSHEDLGGGIEAIEAYVYKSENWDYYELEEVEMALNKAGFDLMDEDVTDLEGKTYDYYGKMLD